MCAVGGCVCVQVFLTMCSLYLIYGMDACAFVDFEAVIKLQGNKINMICEREILIWLFKWWPWVCCTSVTSV